MMVCGCLVRASLGGHRGLLALVAALTSAGLLLLCLPADALQQPALPPSATTAPQVASSPGSPGGTPQEPVAAGQPPGEEQQSKWALLGLPEPNPNAPYANPPKLELLFDDDFTTDSRGDYEIGGKEGAVGWESGMLTLRDGARLTRPLNGDNWVELELDIEFPELGEDGQKSELKVLLDLEPATDSYLVLRQRRADGRTTSEIVVYDTPSSSPNRLALAMPQKVRSERLDRALSSGSWRIVYNGGLWAVDAPDESPRVRACIENGHAIVVAAGFSSTGQSCGVQKIRWKVAPLRVVEWSADQASELNRAEAMNERVLSLVREGRAPDGLSLAEQALGIRLKLLGTFHPNLYDSFTNLAYLLDNLGRAREAEPMLEQALAITKGLYPDDHPYVARGLFGLAWVRESLGRAVEAEPLYEQALAMNQRLFPGDHPDVANCLNSLANARQFLGRVEEAEPLLERAVGMYRRLYPGDHPAVASSVNNLAQVHQALGRAAEAEPLFEQALAMRKRLFPDDHPDVALSLNNLALVRLDLGRAAEAEPQLVESLAMYQRLFPGDHPDVARSLENLAGVRQALGRWTDAEPLFEQALAMRKRLFPGDHSHVAYSLNNLANLRHELGRAAEAEPLLEQSLAMLKRLFPGDHPDVAKSLHNLANVRAALGRAADAELLLEQSLAMRRRLFPGDHPDVADSLNGLAYVRDAQGRAAEAESLYEQALAMRQRLFPNDHPSVANSISNLAHVRESLGRAGDAELLFEQAFAMFQRLYPDDHPSVAASLNNLAFVRESLGRAVEAEPLYEQALAMNQRLFPGDHPDVANCLHKLAVVQRILGNLSRADVLFRDSAEMTCRILDRDSRFLTEEQQLAQSDNCRRYFDGYFDLSLEYPDSGPSLRALWWRWKGAVTLRQQQSRLVLRSGDARTRELARQLQDAARQLATLANAVPDDPAERAAWREQLARLSDERTRLERELAANNAEFRAVNEVLRSDPETIVEQLPDDCLVVDLIQQRSGSPPQYLALVSRRVSPAVLVPLGSVAEIDALIEQAQAREWATGPATEGVEPATLRLRRLVWDRLAEHLTGIQTVLISPDGLLATVPWGALPGSEPGSYLIEQYAIGVLPAPQVLGRLLPSPGAEQTLSAVNRSLLLVGDVDYGAAPGASTLEVATRSAPEGTDAGGSYRNWSELSSAGPELSAVRDLFEDSFPEATVTRLRRAEATEDRFRIEAPRHSVLHLVTHGYFAPEQMKSVFQSDDNDHFGLQSTGDRNPPHVTGYPPGLLSGIVLAGANRRPEPGQDDGILTALEVTELDLRGVDLVTLSACQTGLGPVAGGEGLLGLQRSFQLAGAGTVVASLWKVPDAETQLLMQEFHRNLWMGKLGKLESLRQAQLKLLIESRPRGGEDDLGAGPAKAAPRHWAAWVLSGDWR